jgi:hypothetical protein
MAKWECCGEAFSSEEELARHDVEVHGAAREPVASCCGLRFFTREGLEAHRRTVHGEGARGEPS